MKILRLEKQVKHWQCISTNKRWSWHCFLTNSIKCEFQIEILKCVRAYISTQLFIQSASSAGWDSEPPQILVVCSLLSMKRNHTRQFARCWRIRLHSTHNPVKCARHHVMVQQWYKWRDTKWPWHYPLHPWHSHPDICSTPPTLPDKISPDEQKAGSGRDQEIVWKHIRIGEGNVVMLGA